MHWEVLPNNSGIPLEFDVQTRVTRGWCDEHEAGLHLEYVNNPKVAVCIMYETYQRCSSEWGNW